MAGKSIKNFGAALRQGFGGANQGVHAGDMENGATEMTAARMLPWLGLALWISYQAVI